MLPALISAPTAKTHWKQRFHDISAGASECVGTCGCGECKASTTAIMHHYAFCAVETYQPKYLWNSVVSSLDSCPWARIGWKLKKQSNSKRAKLSCGKQCLSKFLSGCNLQQTLVILQKIRTASAFSYCIIWKIYPKGKSFFICFYNLWYHWLWIVTVDSSGVTLLIKVLSCISFLGKIWYILLRWLNINVFTCLNFYLLRWSTLRA